MSHDKAAIQSICDRCILLDAGRLGMEGSPQAVMDYYNGAIAEKEITEESTVRQSTDEEGRTQTVSGTGEATITGVSLLDAAGEALEVVDVDAPVTLEVLVRARQPIPRMVLGFMVKDRLGLPIYGTNTHHLHAVEDNIGTGEELGFRFHFRMALGEGSYSVSLSISDGSTHLNKNYEWRDLALVFEVVNQSKDFFLGSSYLAVRHDILRRLPQAS